MADRRQAAINDALDDYLTKNDAKARRRLIATLRYLAIVVEGQGGAAAANHAADLLQSIEDAQQLALSIDISTSPAPLHSFPPDGGDRG